MSASIDDLNSWIEAYQVVAYSDAAEQLGLGSDPVLAWERLAAPPKGWGRSAGAAQLPTRFEHPTFYPLLNRSATHLQSESRGDLFAQPARVATMPTGDVNAQVLYEPNSGLPVLFFQQGLMVFLGDFARLLGWALPPMGIGTLLDDRALLGLPHHYTMPPKASEQFTNTLVRYVVEGTPIEKPDFQVQPPPHNLDLVTLLHLQMLSFIVAHELGHVASKHRPSTWEKENEFEADSFGSRLAAETFSEDTGTWRGRLPVYPCAAAIWATDLALSCLTLLHKAMAWIAFGPEIAWISPTHPDDLSRRERLRSSVGASEGTVLSSDTVRAVEELLGMSDAVLTNIGEWASAACGFARAREMQPSPLWNAHLRCHMAKGLAL